MRSCRLIVQRRRELEYIIWWEILEGLILFFFSFVGKSIFSEISARYPQNTYGRYHPEEGAEDAVETPVNS